MRATHRDSVLFPNFIAKSVLELRPEELIEDGITHLVFDIDETIVPKKHNQLSQEYIDFLQSLEKKGLKILIGSNSKRNLHEITHHLQTEVVPPSQFSFKPLRSYFEKAIKLAGVNASHIAMVGDRILNDVIGGNHAGLTTILVEPYARRQSKFHRWYITWGLKRNIRDDELQ